jgi:amidase
MLNIDSIVSIKRFSNQEIVTLFHCSNMAISTWESKVASKQQAGCEKIPKEWLLPASITKMLQVPLPEHPNRIIDMDIPRKSGIMSGKELEITEKYTVEELLEQLRNGRLSSLEVTLAFSKRAAIAQQLVRSCSFQDAYSFTYTVL